MFWSSSKTILLFTMASHTPTLPKTSPLLNKHNIGAPMRHGLGLWILILSFLQFYIQKFELDTSWLSSLLPHNLGYRWTKLKFVYNSRFSFAKNKLQAFSFSYGNLKTSSPTYYIKPKTLEM
jgi:hypothetical protein